MEAHGLTRELRAESPRVLTRIIMAGPGLVQRSLQSLSDTARAVRTGEGEGAAARLGRQAKKGLAKAKGGIANLKVALGFSEIDAYEEDVEDERKRKRQRQILGNEMPLFVAKNGNETRDLQSTVAPEFRAQLSAGLASANSFTAGSTLVNGRAGAESDDADS